MAKRLNVELGFTADTSQAKRQIDDLVSQLQKIQMAPSKTFDSQGLKDASKAAQELQAHIQSAINVDTGKLDLTKFSTSLTKSNTNLEYFRKELNKAGADGKSAFSTLANSITQADAPMLRLGGRLGEFVTTLKNSARWQISSNILHSFESAISSAYGYAKDLDESLNSIRIVTGQSTDQMADFAKEANEAAKALSTTTTNYTDASLIYYQQGLSDEEVKKRTDITVKMGNAAQESAEQVSQYMTAIWENYYDGSESLESYADKITALGAATASSSKEIANGLDKFVSVGKQIGLSYDYATAALTTIIAKTRQSEDVVGTALKTIFARIQGFNLGETADDGVTLNKYSSALAAIGVNVLDVNGKMKDMDTILDETAAKWGSLSTAQQNALSQTVAGVRQYTQFSTLMNNWDFMKENLQTIEESGGALQKQADTYAESWEAARKRVKASWEGIFDELIDTDGIIKLDNALATVLDTLGDVINGFGGLHGILIIIAGFVAQKFAKEVPSAINQITSALSIVSGKSQANAVEMMDQVAKTQRANANDLGFVYSENLTNAAELEGAAKLAEMKAQLTKVSGNLSNAEKEEAKNLIALTEQRYKSIAALGSQIETQKKAIQEQGKGLAERLGNASTKATKMNANGIFEQNPNYNTELEQNTQKYDALIKKVQEYYETLGKLKTVQESINSEKDIWAQSKTNAEQLNQLTQSAKTMIETIEGSGLGIEELPGFDRLKTSLQELNTAMQNGSPELENYKEKVINAMMELASTSPGIVSDMNQMRDGVNESIEEILEKLRAVGPEGEAVATVLENKLKPALEGVGSAAQRGAQGLNTLGSSEIKVSKIGFAEGITKVIGSLGMLGGSASGLSNTISTLGDETASFGTKFSSVMSSMTSSIFTIRSVTTTLAGLFNGMTQLGGAAATVGAKMAAFGTGGIGIAVTVALGAMTAFLSYKKHLEEVKKEHEEALEASKQYSESLVSEKKQIDDTADAFRAAKEKYDEAVESQENVAEAKSDLDSITDTLVEKLGQESEAFDTLKTKIKGAVDKYDELYKAIALYNREQLTEQIKGYQQQIDDSTQVIEDKAKSKSITSRYYDYSDSELEKKANDMAMETAKEEAKASAAEEGYVDKKAVDEYVSDYISWNSGKLRDEWLPEARKEIKASAEDLSSYLEEQLSKIQNNAINYTKLDKKGATNNGFSLDIDLDNASIEEKIKAYQDLKQALEDSYNEVLETAGAGKAARFLDSDGYKQIEDYLNTFGDAVQDYLDAIDGLNGASAELAVSDVTNGLQTQVSSMEEYLEIENAAIEELKSQLKGLGKSEEEAEEIASKAVRAYMRLTTQYSDFADTLAAKDSFMEDALEKGWDESQIQEFLDGLNDEELELLVQLNLDVPKSVDNLQDQLDTIKAMTDFSDVMSVSADVSSAAKSIKNNKTSESDYQGIDWGNEELGIIEFNEFMQKSQAEQAAYLLDYVRSVNNNFEYFKQQALDAIQEQIDELTKQKETVNDVEKEAIDKQLLELKQRQEEINNSTPNTSAENDENLYGLMDDYTKLIYLMTTSEQLSGDLQEELANLIATVDGFDIADRFLLLQNALAADKISVLDLKGALDEIISNGGVNLDDLKKFQEDLSADPFIEAKDAVSIYVSGLQELAAQYDNCTKELNDYQIALQTNNETLIANTQANLELATRVGEDAQLYDIDTERLESLTRTYLEEAESLDAVKNGLISAEEAAENMARADIRANDAISALYDMQDDVTDLMREYNEALADNASNATAVVRADKNLSKILSEVKDNVAGLLDTSSDLLDDDWILKNMDKIQAAAAGDQEALESLKDSSTVEILINSNIDDLGIDVDDLANKINELPDGEIHLDDNAWLQESVDLLSQAGMTAEQIQDLFSAAGIDLNFEPAIESMNAVGDAAAIAGVAAGANWADNLAEAGETNVDLEAKTFTDTDNQEAAGFTSTLREVQKTGTFTVPITDGDRIYPRQYGLPYTVYSQITTPDVTNEDVSKQTTVTNPKISSANKKGAGKITRTNLPGGSNKSGGSGGGRGGRKGGGGGGSGSTPRAQRFTPSRQVDTKGLIKDNRKKLKDEQERYHLINSELKMISKNLADIDQVKSRAFGKNKLNAIKAENKQLTIQAKKQAELLAQAREYLKQDRKKVEALGATIGDDGSITNYDALTQGWVKEYNKGIKSWAKQQKQSVKTYDAAVKAATDKFNASDRGDAAKEVYDTEVEKAKKEKEVRDNRIERFKKDLDEEYEEKKEAIDQYEETAEKERDEALKEQQIKDQIYDNELEIIQYEIQLKVDVSDTSVKILEELFDQLGDDADKAADRIANLQKQTEQYVNQADYYREGIEKILRHAGANDDLVNSFLSGNLSQSDIEQLGALGLTEGDAEALKDYQEKLLDLNQQYRDLKDEMMNEVSSAFDNFMDDLDRTAQKIEHLQKVTETYKNIIDIVGKKILDPTGTLSNRLSRTSFEQARSLTQASKSELEFAEKSLAKAKKTRASLAARYGDDDQIVKDWDKQVKELEDKRDEAYENWLSNWEAECQAARDIYEDSMNTILTNFESKISGLAGSLDALSDAYERQSKIDEVYVDDYEKIYQLSKLSRQINASIDDTTQIKNKQQLKKLQEEINKAQEQGVKMSQYDLDVLQKKYDLEVARQQLEEAQNAKTKVTMQRDSEGNYGYVYTADSKAVADAEQSYEDKLHELQVLNSDYIKQLQSDMIQLQQECQNALQDFAEDFKGSPEEYAKGVQAILDQYQVLMNAKYQQMGNAINNNKTLYENDWKAYSEATGYKISVDEDYIDKWGETNLSMITGYKTMGKAMEDWKSACEQTAKDSITAYQTWYEDTDTALKDGGTSMEDFKGTAEDVLTDVREKTDAAAKSAKDMSTAYQASFTDILAAAKEFCKNYKEEIEPAIALNDRLAEAIAKVLAEASKADSETNTGDTSGSGSGSGNGNENGDNSANGSGTETATPSQAKEIADMTAGVAEEPKKEKKKLTKKIKYGVALAIINGKDNHYGWGEDPERAKRLKAKFGASNGIQALINSLYREGKVQNGSWVGQYSGLREEDLDRFAYSRFNTGGYTGIWSGNQGKLAVLDSKEIVLNKEDTENFLNAVDIVREIANTIDLNAASASNGFARLFAAAGIKTAPNELQQEVHITAEFPNVTNKNEILDAFDNVINLASQYANRK